MPPAARTPEINDTELRLRATVLREGQTAMPVLVIAEANLPEEACAEIAGKMTPLIREAKGISPATLRVMAAGRAGLHPRGRWGEAGEPRCSNPHDLLAGGRSAAELRPSAWPREMPDRSYVTSNE